jgi:hypothetical protein
MTSYKQNRSDLDALLRKHGVLEGLARELGQCDRAAVVYENDNEPPKRRGLLRRLLGRLRDYVRRPALASCLSGSPTK